MGAKQGTFPSQSDLRLTVLPIETTNAQHCDEEEALVGRIVAGMFWIATLAVLEVPVWWGGSACKKGPPYGDPDNHG